MLYDIGFFVFSLIYLPALIFKGRLHKDFPERFGMYDEAKRSLLSSSAPKIWIEAVSVGEVALLRSLIPLLKERFPGHCLVLSTVTKAGNDLAKRLYSSSATVIYFPLDFSFVVRKVVGLLKPRLYIMVETEIWPNVLRELSAKGASSIVINGRISDRSFGKYLLVKPFLRNILGRISAFCMQSELDAGRIRQLGAPPDRVKVTGNMKFDMDTAVIGARDPQKTRELLGLSGNERLLVAGSTHEGEEEIAVRVHKKLLKEFPDLRLLIAPRHIDRIADVERVVSSFGLKSVKVSSLTGAQDGGSGDAVYLLDTIGRLNDIYAAGTIVFMGGSLIKHGGHNIIEPALFEKAMLFGPHMFNFRDITELFLKGGACVQVPDEDGLFYSCRTLLADDNRMARMGRDARRVVLENRGATESNLDAISKNIG